MNDSFLGWRRDFSKWSCFVFLQQTEMTAEERRKKHQLELKEQLHEEAKVCTVLFLEWDIFLKFLRRFWSTQNYTIQLSPFRSCKFELNTQVFDSTRHWTSDFKKCNKKFELTQDILRLASGGSGRVLNCLISIPDTSVQNSISYMKPSNNVQ